VEGARPEHLGRLLRHDLPHPVKRHHRRQDQVSIS
jgi:hypothetical protein